MTRRKNDALFAAHAVLAALRSSIRLLVAGLAVLILTYLVSGFTVIGPNEVGVVLRFGKLLPQVSPPGLLFALPPPIDEVIKVPVKAVQEIALDDWATAPNEVDASLNPVTQHYSLTGDVNIVRARFILRYQISDPLDYVTTTGNQEQLRDAILYQSVCRVLASMTVEDALTSGKFRIGQDALRQAQQSIDHLKLGLRLVALQVREITPPRSVVASFQNVISAKLQAKTLVEEANAYAAITLPAAQADAFRAGQEADAYAQQTVEKAQGETAAFLAQLQEYRLNPKIIRARLISDMRETVLPQAKSVSVMPDSAGASTLLLSPGGQR